jgi:predicted nucleic acid-binding protein
MARDLPPIVLDASVAIAFLVEEEASAGVRQTVRRWVERGERFVVPSLFWLEVINVLGSVHRLPAKTVLESLYHLDDLDIESVETDRMQLLLTLARVERFQVTAYDATYLALAHSLSAKLATLDRGLAQAAGSTFVDPTTGDSPRRVGEDHAPYEAEGTWPEFKDAAAFLARIRASARPPVAGVGSRH